MIDFEQEFEKFTLGSEGSVIKEIHNIIPAMNQEQMQVIHTMLLFAEKYQNIELKYFIMQYLTDMNKSKNLSFLSSMNMKSLLKAYTQDELIRGIKIQSNAQGEQ